MSTETDWLSVAAALVSAVGGVVAALAAFLSARSARETQAAADAAEHRSTRGQIAADASAVLIEAKRVSNLADQIIQAYRGLATLQGALGGPRLALVLNAAEKKREESSALAETSNLFSDGASSLKLATPDELDRVRLQQKAALNAAQALREDLEREQESIERQLLQVLESMDRTRLAR